MRLHRNLVFAVIDGLHQIFNEGIYADKAVQKLLKRDQRWGSRDRNFVAETTYEIVRWKRLYEEIAEVKAPYIRKDLWRLFAVWGTLRGIALPDWKQIESTPTRRIKGKFDELSKTRKYKASIPDWMDELGQQELGKQWDDEILALNQQAAVILRVNTLKTSKAALQQALLEEAIETEAIKGYPDALQLMQRTNILQTSAFKKGLFEIQDANSQLVAAFMEVRAGQKIVDACAGAGGKTLHLAALLQNKGQIIATDIHENKLKELKRRARRAGAHNIEPRPIKGTKDLKRLYGKADRVLIDAPCSGLGTLRRAPDIKWKLQPEFLNTIRNTQSEILCRYSKMVKSGGKLIYATCSILPSENQKQVQAFLKTSEGANFDLVKDKTMFCHTSGHDGFYVAVLECS